MRSRKAVSVRTQHSKQHLLQLNKHKLDTLEWQISEKKKFESLQSDGRTVQKFLANRKFFELQSRQRSIAGHCRTIVSPTHGALYALSKRKLKETCTTQAAGSTLFARFDSAVVRYLGTVHDSAAWVSTVLLPNGSHWKGWIFFFA